MRQVKQCQEKLLVHPTPYQLVIRSCDLEKGHESDLHHDEDGHWKRIPAEEGK